MKTGWLGSKCLGPKSWEESGVTVYDYGFRIYNPGIARFLSVDPLAPSYAMLTPYQFAGNTPIWAVDLDGLEQLTSQQRQVLEQIADPELGNQITVVVSDADMIHPAGTRRPLVPKVVYSNTDRAATYTNYTPGGLEAAPTLILPDYHVQFKKEDVDVDTSPYDGAVLHRALEDGQRNLRQQNVELAAAAGPELFALLSLFKARKALNYADEAVEFSARSTSAGDDFLDATVKISDDADLIFDARVTADGKTLQLDNIGIYRVKGGKLLETGELTSEVPAGQATRSLKSAVQQLAKDAGFEQVSFTWKRTLNVDKATGVTTYGPVQTKTIPVDK